MTASITVLPSDILSELIYDWLFDLIKKIFIFVPLSIIIMYHNGRFSHFEALSLAKQELCSP